MPFHVLLKKYWNNNNFEYISFYILYIYAWKHRWILKAQIVINELHTFEGLSFPHQQDYVSVMVQIITWRDLWKYWNKDEGDKLQALQLYDWSYSILFSNSIHVYWLLFHNFTCTKCQDRKHLKFELLSRKKSPPGRMCKSWTELIWRLRKNWTWKSFAPGGMMNLVNKECANLEDNVSGFETFHWGITNGKK